jgi:hypothetical protein
LNKNWANDPKVGCKSHCSLIKSIGIYAYLEEFEGVFEKDKVVKV